jgi:hypothetical protein
MKPMSEATRPDTENELFRRYLNCSVQIEWRGDPVLGRPCKIADVIDEFDVNHGLKRMLRAMLRDAAAAAAPLDALDDQVAQLQEVTEYLQYVAMSFGKLRPYLRSPDALH